MNDSQHPGRLTPTLYFQTLQSHPQLLGIFSNESQLYKRFRMAGSIDLGLHFPDILMKGFSNQMVNVKFIEITI